MKHTLTLAAWNIRLARRSLMALWGIFAAQQTALIAWNAARPNGAGAGLASHYSTTAQIYIYLAFYLITALAAGEATHNSRHARSGYTWATLPGTPVQKFTAKAITIAAAELLFTAWQLVCYIVEFFPVTALEGYLARKTYGEALPPANLYEQIVVNNLFGRVLPRRPVQLAILVGIFAVSAVLLAALDVQRGWRKLPALAIGALVAGACLQTLQLEQHLTWLFATPGSTAYLVLSAALTVFSVWWALRSIRRGAAC